MKALVTGGGGFLGGTIIRRLMERGDEVVSFQRGNYPHLDTLGVTSIRGDLTDAKAVRNAAVGCDIVFHVAAKAGVWGKFADYYRPNVLGTENVIAACHAHRIGRLVYTSSPSVVFAGRDEESIDETTPYPSRYLTHYPRTKALAEQAVLKASDENLRTVSLRPHLIWGPGDPHLVPRIVSRAKRGNLRLVGHRENLIDSTYIDNAAEAHLLASDQLARNGQCAGKAYFISNDQPIPIAELINGILKAAGLPAVERRISARTAYVVGAMLEAVYWLARAKREPLMTRFVARQLSTAHWFDLSAARKDLNYRPIVSNEEGLRRLEADFNRA